MNQRKALVIVVCVTALVSAGALLPSRGESENGQAKGRQKWQYGQLYLSHSSPYVFAHWTAGKRVVRSKSAKTDDEALGHIYKDLEGQEKTVSLGVLLDHLGQDGWELVSHTRVLNQPGGGASQT